MLLLADIFENLEISALETTVTVRSCSLSDCTIANSDIYAKVNQDLSKVNWWLGDYSVYLTVEWGIREG